MYLSVLAAIPAPSSSMEGEFRSLDWSDGTCVDMLLFCLRNPLAQRMAYVMMKQMQQEQKPFQSSGGVDSVGDTRRVVLPCRALLGQVHRCSW